MARYGIISIIAGGFDFGLALVLLHCGLSPWLGIAIAMILSGVADYYALEWWGFPRRSGHFSSKRFFESGLVELATYLLRLLFLSLWKIHFHSFDPTEHFLGLAVAYLVAGLFGYAARTRFIFTRTGISQEKHDPVNGREK